MPSDASERRKGELHPPKDSKLNRAVTRGRPRGEITSLDRRTQILNASAQLFAEFGFEATSVRQIADKVNLLAGSLYHHFATKEDILHEILREPMKRVVKDNAAISRLPVDPERKLITSTIARFHRHVHDGLVDTIILNDGKFFRRQQDFAYVEQAKRQSFRVLENVLKEGVEAGQFRPNIDTYLMIGTFSRILSSAAAWFRSGDIYSSNKPASYTYDRVLDFHLDCTLRMIRAPSRLEDPIPRDICETLARLK